MVPGIFAPGEKRPGRADDHLSPFNAKVKNEWSNTSSLAFTCMVCRSTNLLLAIPLRFIYFSLLCPFASTFSLFLLLLLSFSLL